MHHATGEVHRIDPESPERLRSLIDALSTYKAGATVIRVEVQFAPSTRDPNDPAVNIIVTHSMGADREEDFARLIGQVFAKVLNEYSQSKAPAKTSAPSHEVSEGGGGKSDGPG